MTPTVSVIIVNYNGLQYLDECFSSLFAMDTREAKVELIMIDNGSSDNSVAFVKERFPAVNVIEHGENHFGKAVNLGIEKSTGSYLVLLNNDTAVDRNWLNGLIRMFDQDAHIGAVQSKVMFADRKTINSTGVREVEDFYFSDIGFEEADAGQYEKPTERDYFTGGSVMISRACLDDVGYLDEDYIMFFEDVDYSIRCRDKGWKIFYSPSSVVYHRYHGSCPTEFGSFFCSRNRLICLAKHFPARLPGSVRTSHFYLLGQLDLLYDALLQAAKKLVECHDGPVVRDTFLSLMNKLVVIFGDVRAYNFLSRLETLMGLRKIKIAFYDDQSHYPGGRQRYAATIAETLQDTYDVTYIANKEFTPGRYKQWFGIDLSGCTVKTLAQPVPHEARQTGRCDDAAAAGGRENALRMVSEESLNYDVFVNASAHTDVAPLSPLSIAVYPRFGRKGDEPSLVQEYDYVVAHSSHACSWIEKMWGPDPVASLIYPPVDMHNGRSTVRGKKNIILSIARFEPGGAHKQVEMIQAFAGLAATLHELRAEWSMVLAGLAGVSNSYFEKVQETVERLHLKNVQLKPDLRREEIAELYADAMIFWHAGGLDATEPELMEHSGTATVEAMQNYCVPIVYDGGGLKDIVEQGVSGYRFSTIEELLARTMAVVSDGALKEKLAVGAFARSHNFSIEVFRKNVRGFFLVIESELAGVDALRSAALSGPAAS
ncbi:MAG TPA: glycosyltransferase [Syntrophorhabdales bacterium]|nr:glycosyltransferase [Syntrophorhabdales bacterium]